MTGMTVRGKEPNAGTGLYVWAVPSSPYDLGLAMRSTSTAGIGVRRYEVVMNQHC
jgi:hypothetical protein